MTHTCDGISTNHLNAAGLLQLPEQWKVVRFGRIVRKSQYGLSLSEDPDGEIPMLRMNNIEDGRISTSELVHVSLSEEDRKQYLLRQGDFLLNRTNSYDLIGKSAVVEEDSNCTFASYLVRFDLDRAAVEPQFVCYYFNRPGSRKLLQRIATRGVSQCNINPTSLQRYFLIPVPPLQEQKSIVAILALWDRAIEQSTRLIEAKRRLKAGVLQQLFTGKRRFPEFVRTAGTRATRFGAVPGDWDYPKIECIASEVTNRNTNGEDIQVLSCTKYDGLVDSLEYFGRRIFSEDTSGYKVVKPGQFAYATNHIEEGSIGLLDDADAGLVSPMYTVFETNSRVHPPFLYKVFKTELYRHIFQVNTSASVNRRGGLRWADFARIHVPLPSLYEQKKISDCIDTFEAETHLLHRQLDALRTQKKALMQKLLTGQIRVKV